MQDLASRAVDHLEAVEERELHVDERAVRAEHERPHAGVELERGKLSLRYSFS